MSKVKNFACISENSPPLLGFDHESIQTGSQLTKSYRNFICNIRDNLKPFCSTPLGKKTYKQVMELSFSLECDGDSGYVSHFQESNSESGLGEIAKCNSIKDMVKNNIYISEDALLERPEVNEDIIHKSPEECYEEYSHLFYISNSTVNSSGGSGKTCLSGLGNESDVSSIIYPISSIKVLEQDIINSSQTPNKKEIILNSPIIPKFKKTHCSPFKRKISASPIKNNYKCLDENKENDVNLINHFKVNEQKDCSNILKDNNMLKNVFQEKALTSKQLTQSPFSKLVSNLNTSQSYIKTPLKDISLDNSCLSPELFSDDETTTCDIPEVKVVKNKSFEEVHVNKDEEILLNRARRTLKGVLPPPSVTIIQISTGEILNKIHNNQHLFLTQENKVEDKNEENVDSNTKVQQKSLLIGCKYKDIECVEWPEILKYRFHGLLHNKGKFSEEFEHLCQKYGERYVGVETQSTCTVFANDMNSPSKKKPMRLRKLGKSPGKRLSHLARRRITFSKDSHHSSNFLMGVRSRQILIDARKQAVYRKSPRKTPRKSPRRTPRKSPRRTPRKSPRKTPRKRKTPSSSTKKRRISEIFSEAGTSYSSPSKRFSGQSPSSSVADISEISSIISTSSSTSTSTSKRRTPRRALFPSPQKSLASFYPKKKLTPKRALFMSPDKENNCDKKRKRTEEDEEEIANKCKMPRSLSFPAQSSTNKPETTKIFTRLNTTGSISSVGSNSQNQELTEHRKKKLLWAVSEALRSQNISMQHPQFKVFASVLARVTRRLLPNLNTTGPRPEGSTSELMLRIAMQHVFAVTRGKTVDEIIREVEKNKLKMVVKPTGYVAPERERENNNVRIQCNKPTTSGVLTQSNQIKNSVRNEKVERIRRAINFGDCDEGTKNNRSNDI